MHLHGTVNEVQRETVEARVRILNQARVPTDLQLLSSSNYPVLYARNTMRSGYLITIAHKYHPLFEQKSPSFRKLPQQLTEPRSCTVTS